MSLKKFKKFITGNYVFIVNLIALSGTLGSLYYSEARVLTPCDLCWYQRIFLYPIAIVTFVALAYKDSKVYRYILPMSTIGMCIAGYHYFIQKFDFAKELSFCNVNNPCTTIDIEYLGFITIPLMSFIAFLTINILSILYLRFSKDEK